MTHRFLESFLCLHLCYWRLADTAALALLTQNYAFIDTEDNRLSMLQPTPRN
jgi:hypothetical protein